MLTEEYLDEDNYEDDDEPVSAAQLLGHGYAGRGIHGYIYLYWLGICYDRLYNLWLTVIVYSFLTAATACVSNELNICLVVVSAVHLLLFNGPQ